MRRTSTLGDSPSCICSLGACDASGAFDHDKYNAIVSKCGPAERQAAIEAQVVASLAESRKEENNPNLSDIEREVRKAANDTAEICQKLQLFTQCANEPSGGQGCGIEHATRQPDGSCACDAGFVRDQAEFAKGNVVCVAAGGSSGGSAGGSGAGVGIAIGVAVLGLAAWAASRKKR
jgi:hypothetical protein